MLRLKLALKACGMSQQELVKASGYSKALVSRVLTSGELPQDADKFRRGVQTLVIQDNKLSDWIFVNNLTTEDMCEPVPDPGQDAPVLPLPTPVTLGRLLCDIAGRAVLLDDDSSPVIIQLARTIDYLHTELRILVGEDAPWTVRTEAEAAAILTGGQA